MVCQIAPYEVIRDRVQQAQWRRSLQRPYFAEYEVFVQDQAIPEEEEQPKRDYWVFDEHRAVLQRHHIAWRKSLFNPAFAEGCPVPLRAVKKGRSTRWINDKGKAEMLEDEWSLFTKKEERLSWWRGVTEFPIDTHFLADSAQQRAVPKKKRGEGEVFPHEISAEEWPAWKIQDEEEFKKIVDSGALRILSVEESKQIWKQLEAEGKTDRVIPSRMVRRYKPGEGPGAPRTRKSRFCIRGDRDPDILSLVKICPDSHHFQLAGDFPGGSKQRIQRGGRRPQVCLHPESSFSPQPRTTLLQVISRKHAWFGRGPTGRDHLRVLRSC